MNLDPLSVVLAEALREDPALRVVELDVFVPTSPTAKGRPRFTKKGYAFTPTKTAQAELRVQEVVSAAWGRAPLEGPLELWVEVGLLKPKSKPKGRPCWPTGRPDADNYAKLVMDALNGVVWVDDAQVVRLHASKTYEPVQGVRVVVALVRA